MAPCAVKNDDESEAETNSNVDNGHDSDTEAREDPHYASSSSPTLKRTSTTPHLSTTSPAAASPKLPREGSPVRPQFNAIASTGSRVTSRSRKNSQDLSPIRAPSASIPTVPSAAAIQRALSATRTPHLPAPQSPEFASEAPRSQRTNKGPTLSSQHQALNIVRVESPPSSASPAPKNSVLSAAQKIDQSLSNPKTPTIIVERPDRSSALAVDLDVADENHSTISGTRTPARGMSGNALPLETVQEGSAPATPATGINRSAQTVKGASNDRPDRIDENPMEEAFEKEAKPKAESGNESAGSKRGGTKGADDTTEKRKTATIVNSVQPPMIQSKRSLTQLPFTRTKTATDGSVKNMTVETETVSSIPQVALGGGAGERNILGRTDTGGTLRIKPSTETIRPKKEKKKVARKAPSLNSGTGRSLGTLHRHHHHHHHHHIQSRPPPFHSIASLPFTAPESCHSAVLAHDKSKPLMQLGSCEDKYKYLVNAHCGPQTTTDPQENKYSTNTFPRADSLLKSRYIRSQSRKCRWRSELV